MIKISPSILSADFTKIYDAVKMLEAAGADYIHCDVMDGSFVPNITFGQYMIRDLRKATKLPLDVHLMIDNPDKYIEEFAQAGADIITVHEEATKHLDRSLQLIRSTGKKAGVSLNPHTPLCVLDYVLYNVDMVLLMSVNPGFGGQSFISSSLRKASELKTVIEKSGYNIDIEMDGGIGPGNIKAVIDSGVNVIVSGNTIFKAEDPAAMIKLLRCGQ